jgi:hypothetical protein
MLFKGELKVSVRFASEPNAGLMRKALDFWHAMIKAFGDWD